MTTMKSMYHTSRNEVVVLVVVICKKFFLNNLKNKRIVAFFPDESKLNDSGS